MSTTVSSYAETLKKLEETQSKVKDGASLSYDEMNELRKLYPQLESAIYRTADGWGIEVKALDNVRQTSKDLAIAQIQAEKDKTKFALINSRARIGLLVDEATTQAQFTKALLGNIQGSSQGVVMIDEQKQLQAQFNLFQQLKREAKKYQAEIATRLQQEYIEKVNSYCLLVSEEYSSILTIMNYTADSIYYAEYYG
jgi:hypothetical protein